MPRLHLVRHGEASAGWGQDLDPGLSATGIAQAEAVAATLASLGPLPIVCSPLRRTRETAAPLAARWQVEPVIETAVGEIPSPSDDLAERAAWLGELFRTPWDAWPAHLVAWRRSVVDALCELASDTVVFTHYVAITVAAGIEGGFHPDYCSVTVVEPDGRGALHVVERGASRTTVVR